MATRRDQGSWKRNKSNEIGICYSAIANSPLLPYPVEGEVRHMHRKPFREPSGNFHIKRTSFCTGIVEVAVKPTYGLSDRRSYRLWREFT